MLNELVRLAHENAVEHGFYDHFDGKCLKDESLYRALVLSQIAKIGGEVGECVDAIQTQKNPLEGTLPEELADVCIRIFDLCGWLGIDLDAAVAAKMKKNRGRPYRHGKFC